MSNEANLSEAIRVITGKWFNTVYLVVLENHGWTQTQNLKAVDYFTKNGMLFNNWTATAHPSGPNYRTLMSGNYWSYNEYDGVHRPNIGDSVPCVIEDYVGIPAVRHNPFMDMQSGMVVPNARPAIRHTFNGIWYFGMDDQNNGHSAAVSVADNNVMNLVAEFEQYKASYLRWIMFFVFDEAFGCDWFSNHVFAGMIGSHNIITPGKIVHSPLRHENFAQMLYDNWEIPAPEEMLHTGRIYKGKEIYTLD